ncbi:MAG: hypothetical protein QNJ69_03560 [Gammaproteobacteria bacterium]|nr:hypothetical protein [Gammaproteobacteria bacterium]
MFSKLLKVVFLIIYCGNALGNAEGDQIIDDIMRGLGIKYLVSDDRRLPKKDRAKWEASLSEYVDFDSLNNGMKLRIRDAVKTLGKTEFDHETSSQLEEKAVLFLVPRQLSDYTLAYLKKKDKINQLEKCTNTTKPSDGERFTLCFKSVSVVEKHVQFIGKDTELILSLIFIKKEKWKLSDIISPISEETLALVARWK